MNFRKSFKRPLTGLLQAESQRSWASWGPLKLLVRMYGNITGNIQDIYGNSSSTWIEHYQLMLDMFQKKRPNSNIAGQQLKLISPVVKTPLDVARPLCHTVEKRSDNGGFKISPQNAISHHRDFIILSYPVKRTYCRRLPKSAPRPPPPARRGMASRRGTAGGTTRMKERKKRQRRGNIGKAQQNEGQRWRNSESSLTE